MTADEFNRLVEEIFRPARGRRGFIKVAYEALGLSKAQFHRYARGEAAVPEHVADRLSGLRRPAPPSFPHPDLMAVLGASALAKMQRDREANGRLTGGPRNGRRASAASVYPAELTRLVDVMSAANRILPAAMAAPLPDSLPRFLADVRRPCGEWLRAFGAVSDPLEDVVLLDAEGKPTQEAFDLSARDGQAAEEARVFESLLAFCRRLGAEGPAVYTVFRRLIIQTPVIVNADELLYRHKDLWLVPGAKEMLLEFYHPVVLARTGRRAVPVCRHSGVLLAERPDGSGFETECPHPEAVNDARAGVHAEIEVAGEALVLKHAFRLYWLYPGLTELRLHDRLQAAGYAVALWPLMDLVDLVVAAPHLAAPLAIDVKDQRSAGRLADSFDPAEVAARLPGHDIRIVVPDHRDPPGRNYCGRFRAKRDSYGKPFVRIQTASDLLGELRA
ncbi:restriction endonuclease-related protein [Azospirillum palustre]